MRRHPRIHVPGLLFPAMGKLGKFETMPFKFGGENVKDVGYQDYY